MFNERHVMLDIETLSKKQNAAVPSIGACIFSPYAPVEDHPESYLAYLDLKEQSELRHVDIDTVQWWLRQDKDAQNKTFSPGKQNILPVNVCLSGFQDFCTKNGEYKPKQIFIWGNGKEFDNLIMRSLFDHFNMEFPCPYYNDMDLRTLRKLQDVTGIQFPSSFQGTKHSALDDAINQAAEASFIFGTLCGMVANNKSITMAKVHSDTHGNTNEA